MNLFDKVYYTEYVFGQIKYNILETTIEKAIKFCQYTKKEAFDEFKKYQTEKYFVLRSIAGGYLSVHKFYFNRNDAVEDLLTDLNTDISKKESELNYLKEKRDKLVSEMT